MRAEGKKPDRARGSLPQTRPAGRVPLAVNSWTDHSIDHLVRSGRSFWVERRVRS